MRTYTFVRWRKYNPWNYRTWLLRYASSTRPPLIYISLTKDWRKEPASSSILYTSNDRCLLQLASRNHPGRFQSRIAWCPASFYFSRLLPAGAFHRAPIFHVRRCRLFGRSISRCDPGTRRKHRVDRGRGRAVLVQRTHVSVPRTVAYYCTRRPTVDSGRSKISTSTVVYIRPRITERRRQHACHEGGCCSTHASGPTVLPAACFCSFSL